MQDINDRKQQLTVFFRRFHLVIFIVATVLVLSVAVVLLYKIVIDKASGANSLGNEGSSLNFDQSTIERIKELKTSDEPSEPLDMSSGRIDPFNE